MAPTTRIVRPAGISDTTRAFAVLGSPIAHSLSPAIHTASFTQLGLDGTYTAFDVGEAELDNALGTLIAEGFSGANLTMPLKTAAIRHLDAMSAQVELIGATNTLTFDDGRIIGTNTDGKGMMRALAEAGTDMYRKRVVIFGAGGAARSIAVQAAIDGASHITLTKRPGPRFQEATIMAYTLSAMLETDVKALEHGENPALEKAVRRAHVLINATPIGMGTNANAIPVPATWIEAHHTVADAVYHPRRTRLLAAAETAGARAVEGINMLLWQALEAEDEWFGKGTTDSINIPALIASLPLAKE